MNTAQLIYSVVFESIPKYVSRSIVSTWQTAQPDGASDTNRRDALNYLYLRLRCSSCNGYLLYTTFRGLIQQKKQSHIALRTKPYLFYALRKESLAICLHVGTRNISRPMRSVMSILCYPFRIPAELFFSFFFLMDVHIAVLVFNAMKEAPDSPS